MLKDTRKNARVGHYGLLHLSQRSQPLSHHRRPDRQMLGTRCAATTP